MDLAREVLHLLKGQALSGNLFYGLSNFLQQLLLRLRITPTQVHEHGAERVEHLGQLMRAVIDSSGQNVVEEVPSRKLDPDLVWKFTLELKVLVKLLRGI